MPYFGIPIRNGLPIGLGSVAGFGIAPFSPESLFENGEVGAWYDPSDYSTLFTDSAGTTPVSAPGNGSDVFVGLMLDKSKGLVLGPELVTNGDFSSGTTGWTGERGGVLSVVSGALRVTQGSVTDYALGYQAVTLVIGQWYKLTVDFVGGTASTVQVGVGTSNTSADATFLANATAPQTLTVYFAATATTMYVRSSVNVSTNNVYADFDNFSLKAVSGNHAFQTNSLKRPELRARYNLLTNTPFAGGGAAPTGYTQPVATGTSAPDGAAANGDTIYLQTATAQRPFLSITITAPVSLYTASFTVYAVTGTITYADILSSSTATGGSYTNNGVVVSSSAQVTPGRIVLDGLTTTSGSPIFRFGLGVQANVTGTLRFSSPDVRPASQATGLIGPTYQRVAAANVYDTAGFLPYLFFDGLSWSMSTNSIDFSAGDKMTVWAGVRKLSDAALGMLAETSAVANSNNGAIAIGAPGWNPVAARYGSLIKGTSANALYANSPASFASPITNVLAMQYNLAGASNSDVMQMRLNAASQSLTFFDGPASGGNFGNYPLYIGMRNNASFPFNGWLTSLIIRGAQSTQSQIEATEAWVNSRTGAY